MSVNFTPEFKIGQTVEVVIERQGSHRGNGSFGGNVKAAKLMEIARVEVLEEDDVLSSGFVWRTAGVYYNLRRPGGKGKGGNVLWSETDLQLAA